MGFAFAGVICAGVTALALLLIASGLLRLALFATNTIVGPARERAKPRTGIAEWDWDDWEDEPLEPLEPELVRVWEHRAVPEAGTFKCTGIVVLTALAFGLGFVLMGFAAQDVGFRMHRSETRLAVAVLNLPVAGLVLAALLAVLLPTGFRRAAQVAFVYLLIVIVFLALVASFVLVVGSVFR